jgi:glycosyltransferase involved in cell wall biosynthesis
MTARRPRILLVSRIFAPEPGAASLRLMALASTLGESGFDVTVVTSQAPKQFRGAGEVTQAFRIRRAPVLRDKLGYVRGYAQYMSFDIPAFFRVVFSRKFDALIVEPPPTTGVFMRAAAAIRRRPYLYFAADIWSDASRAAGVASFVSRTVARLERWALNGASTVLSVSEPVTDRLREMGVTTPITTVGNGIDTTTFCLDGPTQRGERPYFLYAGTASEVHGAKIFVDAFRLIAVDHPGVDLVFLGQGADRDDIEHAAREIGDARVRFLPRVEPTEAATWLRGSIASLASVKAEHYELGFPTKMYASVACGAPVIYAGSGPGKAFAENAVVGWAVPYDASAIAGAMRQALRGAQSDGRSGRANWARDNVSINAVADRVLDVVSQTVSSSRPVKDSNQ